jgi:hypothetical protein
MNMGICFFMVRLYSYLPPKMRNTCIESNGYQGRTCEEFLDHSVNSPNSLTGPLKPAQKSTAQSLLTPERTFLCP